MNNTKNFTISEKTDLIIKEALDKLRYEAYEHCKIIDSNKQFDNSKNTQDSVHNYSEAKETVRKYLQSYCTSNIEKFLQSIPTEDEKTFQDFVNSLYVLRENKKIYHNICDFVFDNTSTFTSTSTSTSTSASSCGLQENPWSIAITGSHMWIVKNKIDLVSCYNVFDGKLCHEFSVRDDEHNSFSPTGICINTSEKFIISDKTNSAPAEILVCTKNGTVWGYNRNINNGKPEILFNLQFENRNTIFKGLTIVNDTLYIADFKNNSITIRGGNYNEFFGYDTFSNKNRGYSPNNIVNIGDYLYVLYGQVNAKNPLHDDIGEGFGLIYVFDLKGKFIRKFATGNFLNSPHTIIAAPDKPEYPSGGFLVGNYGDGIINIFDKNGSHVGKLMNSRENPIIVPGLRSLAFDANTNKIFATSSSNTGSSVLVIE